MFGAERRDGRNSRSLDSASSASRTICSARDDTALVKVRNMSTTVEAISGKQRRPPRWLNITARVLVVVFVLWAGFVGFMWRIMHRSPEEFGRVMMHLPWEVFLVCPFETMWTQARAGTVHIGDAAPDFALTKLDKTGTVRLSDLNKTQPVVMIFGSYT